MFETVIRNDSHRTELPNLTRIALAALAAVLAAAGCAAPGDPGTTAPDDDPVATIEQASEVACILVEDHGGSVFPDSHVSVMGCPCKAGTIREHATATNTGAGSCTVTGWAAADVHDCRANVLINNSGGGLRGLCTTEVDAQPDCTHDRCTTGSALSATCNTSVQQICSADSHCCNSQWDARCVDEVRTTLHSLACGSPGCAHSECTTGIALSSSCSAPVAQICASDSFCCTQSWDSICVREVATIAGQNCN